METGVVVQRSHRFTVTEWEVKQKYFSAEAERESDDKSTVWIFKVINSFFSDVTILPQIFQTLEICL